MVVGIVPLTAALKTAPEEIDSEGSLTDRIPRLFAEANKPMIVVVDSGPRYAPLVRALRSAGIPVFPSADQAIRSLGRYLCHRRPKIQKNARSARGIPPGGRTAIEAARPTAIRCVLNYDMAISGTPDRTYVLERGCSVCVGKRT